MRQTTSSIEVFLLIAYTRKCEIREINLHPNEMLHAFGMTDGVRIRIFCRFQQVKVYARRCNLGRLQLATVCKYGLLTENDVSELLLHHNLLLLMAIPSDRTP